ncbi:MAG: maltotransferase domain-containing protein, partial [Stellaceae bacterium]
MEEYRSHSWTKPPQNEAGGANRASSTARIAIERLYPEIEGGRYPVKRVLGESFEVWCDIYRDGH